MKIANVLLSIIIVLSILVVSILPVLAESVTALDDNKPVTAESKISESLKEIMKEADAEEKIPVWIWYADINQEEVDNQTYKMTGLRFSDCDTIPSIKVDTMMKAYQSDNGLFSDYLKQTETLRKREEKLTDTFRTYHMNIAIDMYHKKANSVMKKSNLKHEDVLFESELAPVIIMSITVNDILRIINDTEIISVSYADPDTIVEYECSDNNYDLTEEYDLENRTREVELAHESIGLNDFFENISGIDGTNVKIGLLEGNTPGEVYDVDTHNITYSRGGFFSENYIDVTYDQITELENSQDIVLQAETAHATEYPNDPLKVIAVAEDDNQSFLNPDTNILPSNYMSGNHFHANNSVNAMIGDRHGIAKGASVYATLVGQGNIPINHYLKYANLETIIKCGISILELNIWSFNHGNSIDELSNNCKYNNHLSTCHGITVIVPGGNEKERGDYTEWINAAGFAENVITVGACKVSRDISDQSIIYQRNTFRWKNSNDDYSNGIYNEGNLYAVEKPDVIMPSNLLLGGTSTASPTMAAVIALMMELKPSLRFQPAAIKAIVLASCQKKAIPATNLEPDETVNSSLTYRERIDSHTAMTEYQGAGIPNAWIMAQIIMQHTYGTETMNSSSRRINIVQPKYNSNNIYISLSWLRGALEN